MDNYTIMHLPYRPVAIVLFTSGICFGGLGGLGLGLLAWDAVGILGGMFLGLVSGCAMAIFGLILTAVFNILAPHIGGLPIKLENVSAPDPPGIKDSYAPLD